MWHCQVECSILQLQQQETYDLRPTKERLPSQPHSITKHHRGTSAYTTCPGSLTAHLNSCFSVHRVQLPWVQAPGSGSQCWAGHRRSTETRTLAVVWSDETEARPCPSDDERVHPTLTTRHLYIHTCRQATCGYIGYCLVFCLYGYGCLRRG